MNWREWAIRVLEAVPPRPGMVIAEMSDETLRYWVTMMLHEGWRWRLASEYRRGMGSRVAEVHYKCCT